MLYKYSPLLSKYNALWAKYGEQPASPNKFPTIETEEDAIKSSVKLNKALESIAKKQNKNIAEIVDAFVAGVLAAPNKMDKLLSGLSKICVAQEIIEEYQLFFSFDSLDDLFLLDGMEKTSVMIFE